VDSRRRVALSKEVLRALELKPGDYVTFEVDPHGNVRLHKLQISVAPNRPSG
jgi:bifunctional DNA-binding transcriptional regulator/antitoxin component of YhaV-PrlF toxin-antitoxin module